MIRFEPRRFALADVSDRACPSLAATGPVIRSTPPSTSVWKTTGKSSRRLTPTSTKKTMGPGVQWWTRSSPAFPSVRSTLKSHVQGSFQNLSRVTTSSSMRRALMRQKRSLGQSIHWKHPVCKIIPEEVRSNSILSSRSSLYSSDSYSPTDCSVRPSFGQVVAVCGRSFAFSWEDLNVGL